MRAKFTGRLDIEWISVNDKMPLDEFADQDIAMIASVFALIVNPEDHDEDPTVVDLSYEVSRDKKTAEWRFHSGEEYPMCHANNIRYWCYPPYYKTKQILQFEEEND